jgi:uncharacterized protein (TIGR02466 family)
MRQRHTPGDLLQDGAMEPMQRAVAAFRAGRLSEAEALARRAGEPGLALLGVALLRQGKAAEAAMALERATRLAPTDPTLKLNLGAALKASGRLVDAAEAFRAAAALRPSAAAQFNLGNALRELGRSEEAVIAYQAAVALESGHAGAWFNLAGLLAREGRTEAAAEAFARAADLDPASSQARLGQASALRELGRLDEAIAAYRQAPRSAASLAGLAVGFGDAGDLTGAAAAYREGLALDRRQPAAWSNLGWTLAELGRLDEAEAALEEALKQEPGFANAHYHMGLLRQRQGDLPGAVAAYERAVAANPRHVRALSALGLALEAQGREGFDYRRLVGRRRFAEVPGFASVAAFNAALAARLKAHPSLMRDRPGRATMHGGQTLDIANDADPAVAAMRRLIETAAADYLAERRDDAYFADPPQRWRLVMWGVVLGRSGYQNPHNHPSGFLSGVYYVALPPGVARGADEAGFLEFGASNVRGRDGGEIVSPNRMRLRPEEGLMALFPSHFWHRTVPYDEDAERISLAFDLAPR